MQTTLKFWNYSCGLLIKSHRFRNINTSSVVEMSAKVGDKLPIVTLYENNPGNKVSTNIFSSKKVLIFGVPGAFTPGCSKTHLPGYVQNYDALKAKGFDELVCVSMNDPFVMAAWGKNQKTDGKIRMLADTKGDLSKALGLTLDMTEVLGSVRSKRYSMIVEEGVIKELNVEPDGTGLTCSLAENFLKTK